MFSTQPIPDLRLIDRKLDEVLSYLRPQFNPFTSTVVTTPEPEPEPPFESKVPALIAEAYDNIRSVIAMACHRARQENLRSFSHQRTLDELRWNKLREELLPSHRIEIRVYGGGGGSGGSASGSSLFIAGGGGAGGSGRCITYPILPLAGGAGGSGRYPIMPVTAGNDKFAQQADTFTAGMAYEEGAHINISRVVTDIYGQQTVQSRVSGPNTFVRRNEFVPMPEFDANITHNSRDTDVDPEDPDGSWDYDSTFGDD